MAVIQFTLIPSFERKGKPDRDGMGQIYIAAYQARKYKYYSTGIRILPKQWHRGKRLVVDHPNAAAYNHQLALKLSEFRHFQVQLINQKFGKEVSLSEFDEKYRSSGGKQLTFTDFYEQELEADNLADSSRTAQRNTLEKLRKVQDPIYFHELTFELLDRFEKQLIKEGLKKTTISKHHKDLKKFIKRAVKKDYLSVDADPYKKFSYDRGRHQPKEFLRLEEVERIDRLIDSELPERFVRTKYIFLLMCYTGLRISDVLALKPAHLCKTQKGWYLDKIMEKTKGFNKKVSLPLNALFKFSGEKEGRAQRVIKKSLMLFAQGKGRQLFQVKTGQSVNRDLKELAKLAGIDKDITCHTGRHTFGTNMAVKVPVTTLQYYMGHSKVETTMGYVQLSKEILDEVLEKIEWTLTDKENGKTAKEGHNQALSE